MAGVSRFTVSVPADLLEAVDEKLIADGESRSAVVRRLLEVALREIEDRAEIEQYIRAYREQPQTEEEFAWTDAVAMEALAEVPWT